MVFVFITVFCVVVALGFGAASARSDFMCMTIPNSYVLAVVVSFFPAFFLLSIFAPEVGFFSSWVSHLLGGGVLFALTYALFHFGFIGGGDAKMLSAYGLWVGVGELLAFLFFTALAGGLLGAVTLYLEKKKPLKIDGGDGWLAKAQAGERKVPYGVAIFLGALITFWQLGYIQPESLIMLASREAR